MKKTRSSARIPKNLATTLPFQLAVENPRCSVCGAEKPSHVDFERMAIADLLKLSFHEAGHYCIASHYGRGSVVVFMADSGCRCFGQKAFVGRTCYYGELRKRFDRAVLGAAGIIAENLPDCESLEQLREDGFDALYFALDNGDLSPSDLESVAGHTASQLERICNTASEVLWERKSEIETVAAELRLHGIYPANATRYCPEGMRFMQSLHPVTRMAFAKGDFDPARLLVLPAVRESVERDAHIEFVERVNAMNAACLNNEKERVAA